MNSSCGLVIAKTLHKPSVSFLAAWAG